MHGEQDADVDGDNNTLSHVRAHTGELPAGVVVSGRYPEIILVSRSERRVDCPAHESEG